MTCPAEDCLRLYSRRKSHAEHPVVRRGTYAVLPQAADPSRVTYRVIGTIRMATFAREMNAAAREGFTLRAFAIVPKEKVAVMEKG